MFAFDNANFRVYRLLHFRACHVALMVEAQTIPGKRYPFPERLE